jgi:hypothetical protein
MMRWIQTPTQGRAKVSFILPMIFQMLMVFLLVSLPENFHRVRQAMARRWPSLWRKILLRTFGVNDVKS